MGDLNESPTVEITGRIMVIAIIILFMVVVFVLLLHLYAKWFWWRIEEPTQAPHSRRNRRRFVFTPGQEHPIRRGLDVSVLKSLPIVIFQSEEFKDGLECAVCLSEISQGEKARLLPKCSHGFHVECIDMWFQSHSTCPLCRNSVAPQIKLTSFDTSDDHQESSIQSAEEILASAHSIDVPNFPTNVLFWGDQSQVTTRGGSVEEGSSATQLASASTSDSSGSGGGSSTSSSGRQEEMLVIDVPLPMNDYNNEEESKSSMPTQRLRSLKRLLSREKRIAPSGSNGPSDV